MDTHPLEPPVTIMYDLNDCILNWAAGSCSDKVNFIRDGVAKSRVPAAVARHFMRKWRASASIRSRRKEGPNIHISNIALIMSASQVTTLLYKKRSRAGRSLRRLHQVVDVRTYVERRTHLPEFILFR